jgi:hypothetical protein
MSLDFWSFLRSEQATWKVRLPSFQGLDVDGHEDLLDKNNQEAAVSLVWP